jgi:hypothetical protein
VTVTLPNELDLAVRRSADQRHVPVDQLVQQALAWYLQIDPELLDEMSAWQEARDEALELVDGGPS